MVESKEAGVSLAIRSFTASEAGAWSNAYLVTSSAEAVLFDVPMLRSDAVKLADRIAGSGKRLKAVFISHAHPDHFLASDLIADRFPAAQFLSTANVVADIEADGPRMLSMLQGRLGAEGPKRLVVPDILVRPALQIDDAIFDVVEFGESEAKHIATAHIPEKKALLSADIVYHDAHLYLQERHIESWLARLVELEGFAENRVATLYPGHGEPGGLELIARTREYLQTFVEAVKNGDAKSVERRMLSAYPKYHTRQFLTAFSIPAYFPVKP